MPSFYWAFQANAAEIESLDVKKESGRYVITAETVLDAPITGIFDVLTDYERFHELSSMITESRFVMPEVVMDQVEKTEDEVDPVIVFTRSEGCVLFFCKKIDKTETMETVQGKKVVTTVIPEHSDVDFSQAKWILSRHKGKTRLKYELTTELGFWVPPLIGPMVVKRAWYSGSERALNRSGTVRSGKSLNLVRYESRFFRCRPVRLRGDSMLGKSRAWM